METLGFLLGDYWHIAVLSNTCYELKFYIVAT